MPLGVTLSELRSELKAESYQSALPSATVAMVEIYNNLLARTQRELWNQYVWPHLLYRFDMPLVIGQRFYSFPATMPFENVVQLFYSQPPQWFPLSYGISNQLYNYYGGEAGRAYPPQRWQNVAKVDVGTGLTDIAGQLEIWPVPAQATLIRFEGQAPLNPLVSDTDKCMIDSTAIVLFAAAELLAQHKQESAPTKMDKAQKYLRRLLARSGANKRGVTALGQGTAHDSPKATPWLDYIPIGG